MKKGVWLLLNGALLGLWFLGCKKSQDDALTKAQHCLDHADRAKAQECRDMLEGLESSEAYTLRCAADFLQQGLTATKMAQAYIKNDSETTTGNPLLGMMGLLAFESQERADQAFQDCSSAGNESFALFASMAQISTTIGSFGTVLETVESGEEPTQEEMETALDTLIQNPTTESQEAIGGAAVLANDKYCKDRPEDKSTLDLFIMWLERAKELQ